MMSFRFLTIMILASTLIAKTVRNLLWALAIERKRVSETMSFQHLLNHNQRFELRNCCDRRTDVFFRYVDVLVTARAQFSRREKPVVVEELISWGSFIHIDREHLGDQLLALGRDRWWAFILYVTYYYYCIPLSLLLILLTFFIFLLNLSTNPLLWVIKKINFNLDGEIFFNVWVSKVWYIMFIYCLCLLNHQSLNKI